MPKCLAEKAQMSFLKAQISVKKGEEVHLKKLHMFFQKAQMSSTKFKFINFIGSNIQKCVIFLLY